MVGVGEALWHGVAGHSWEGLFWGMRELFWAVAALKVSK